jgi:uncharacterized membrane protein
MDSLFIVSLREFAVRHFHTISTIAFLSRSIEFIQLEKARMTKGKKITLD